jgi:LAO/AO transport system kinase
MPNRFTIAELAAGVSSQSRLHLAKAISLVESTLPADQTKAQDLLDVLMPRTGHALRIGITGVPGVGKSTFIEAFALMLIARGHRVAVLAVDPSSARTGGSILGDKTRMIELSRSAEAFIRPSPAGGSLGGVAQRTRESLLLCEAAGFDVVLVETVGVGQSETAVASMVDFFLMLLLLNAGDELQGMKRGIMELADAFVINKADTDRAAAERAAQYIRMATHLSQPKYPDWMPPVLLTSAVEKTGINEVWSVCQAFFGMSVTDEASEISTSTISTSTINTINKGEARFSSCMDDFPERIQHLRRHQAVRWMNDAVEKGLQAMLAERADVADLRRALEYAVKQQEKSPTAAANEVLRLFVRNE